MDCHWYELAHTPIMPNVYLDKRPALPAAPALSRPWSGRKAVTAGAWHQRCTARMAG